MDYVKQFKRNSRFAVSNSDVQKLEDRIGVKLPEDLTSHYLKVNGGIPIKQLFESEEGEFFIHGIMPLRGGDCHPSDISLEGTYQDLVMTRKVLRKSLLPFASDEGGNMFCCSLRKRDFGHVYFVTNEEMLSGERFRLVAKSFKCIIDGLH